MREASRDKTFKEVSKWIKSYRQSFKIFISKKRLLINIEAHDLFSNASFVMESSKIRIYLEEDVGKFLNLF
jgi:hypothetical protein